jgi:monoamine oxidase
MKKEKLIIIGAGLSGLYTAYLLQNQYDITILEARERLGGRVFGIGEHDMGPSWIWNHHSRMLKLIKELDLKLFSQYTHGLAMYDTPNGQAQAFNPPAQAPSLRIVGGISALIQALAKKLTQTSIKLEHKVSKISYKDEIELSTNHGLFKAARVITTLPPRLLAQNISFEPELPTKTLQTLENIPTWMGHACKCVIEYETAFWRDKGLSGFGFSHQGPMGEIHDACTQNHPALFGFLHTNASTDKEAIINQLVKLYGEEAKKYTNFFINNWKDEPYSSTLKDAQGLSTHPNYGFDISHFDNKLHFCGTESAFSEGGYLEGALVSALEVAKKL